ncbi:hypothetical protein GW952_08940 [Klebsiella michiganensis]|uniref:Uncharacterized protein n=1 Tax=Klebsiella michiganensis TaxID=1134687 RepID=A0A6P1UTP4_9ENTR|nr:hypothetical protein [Klebsiella michiganensis]QHS45713.1 hypothetical protein GW952_08940 [Klebsiella michiganensis]
MTISTKLQNNHIIAYTPFNRDFIDEAKMIGGRFNSDEKAWAFDPRYENELKKILIKIFGTDGSSVSNVTVRVTVLNDISEYNAPIIIAGREIAHASGRDSGAKPGTGIIFIERKPQSGGSVKNWTTVLKAGTIFDIQDLPETALHMLSEVDRISYEIQSEPEDPYIINAKIEELIKQRDDITSQIENLRARL